MNIDVISTGSQDGNVYKISAGRDKLLIECGITSDKLRRELYARKELITEYDACLISHSHGDHAQCFLKIMELGVDCYMSTECAAELKVMDDPRARIIPCNQDVYLEQRFGNWKVKAFKAVHDVHCLGFVIDHVGYGSNYRLLYITDSAYNPYEIPGMTHIMAGCNYSMDILNESIRLMEVPLAEKPRILKCHANLETIKKMLEDNDLSNVKEIHLIHISTRNGDPELFKEEIQKLTGKEVYAHAETKDSKMPQV